MKTKIKFLSAVLAAVFVLTSMGVGTAEAKSFSDMVGHWSLDDVSKAVSLGVIDGYPDGTFKPENQITRAEFIKIAVEALDLTQKSEPIFRDSEEIKASWAYPYIQRAVAAGLVKRSEYPDGLGLNVPITRGEIARMVVRGLEQKEHYNPKKSVSLTDVPTGELGGYINKAVERGVINGYPDKTFKPGNTATRAEAVAMIMRAVDLVGKKAGKVEDNPLYQEVKRNKWFVDDLVIRLPWIFHNALNDYMVDKGVAEKLDRDVKMIKGDKKIKLGGHPSGGGALGKDKEVWFDDEYLYLPSVAVYTYEDLTCSYRWFLLKFKQVSGTPTVVDYDITSDVINANSCDNLVS